MLSIDPKLGEISAIFSFLPFKQELNMFVKVGAQVSQLSATVKLDSKLLEYNMRTMHC